MSKRTKILALEGLMRHKDYRDQAAKQLAEIAGLELHPASATRSKQHIPSDSDSDSTSEI